MKTRLISIAFVFLFSVLCAAVAYGEFYVIPARANYKGVIVVAKSGARFSSIQAALDSIDTPGDSNRWLIQVAPGTYDERVAMREYVDIAGSGTGNTIITSSGSESEDEATVLGSNNAELRDLTVQCTLTIDSFSYTIAIINDGTSPKLVDLAVKSHGGSTLSIGILNDNADTIMRDMTVDVSGSITVYGVENRVLSGVTMTDMQIIVSGGAGANRAVYTDDSTARVTRVRALSWGSNSYGFYNREDGLIVLDTVSTTDDFVINPEYGIYNTAGAHIFVYNSRLVGSVSSIYNSGTSTARIANSRLNTATGGQFTCVGCYNGSFESLDGDCQ